MALDYSTRTDAGWSSLVARRAHNPKVAGSNPAPATSQRPASAGLSRFRNRPGTVSLGWVLCYVGLASSLFFLLNRSYTDGAPAKHQSAITGSQMAHPNDESAANGTMG